MLLKSRLFKRKLRAVILYEFCRKDDDDDDDDGGDDKYTGPSL